MPRLETGHPAPAPRDSEAAPAAEQRGTTQAWRDDGADTRADTRLDVDGETARGLRRPHSFRRGESVEVEGRPGVELMVEGYDESGRVLCSFWEGVHRSQAPFAEERLHRVATELVPYWAG